MTGEFYGEPHSGASGFSSDRAGEQAQRSTTAPQDRQPKRAADVKWDHSVDVIVLGSGTGQIAAMRAAKAGLQVLVLEKAPFIGGTTRISGGGIWIPNNYCMRAAGIPDSRAEALRYLSFATFGQGNPELMETFVDTCNAMVDFLRTAGIEWEIGAMFQDYYPKFPGGKPKGRGLRPVSEGDLQHGELLVLKMQQIAMHYGAEYTCETPAERLVIDDRRRVVGVISRQGGVPWAVEARRGVIITTGGFDHNEAMVNSYLHEPLYYPSAVDTNTGDGHLMGMAVGASLRNMNARWGWPVYYNTDSHASIAALAVELGKPGAIAVNRRGERFFNEAGPYDAATRAFYHFEPKTYDYLNIPAYAITDSNHRSRYHFVMQEPNSDLPDWIVVGNSLAELAEKLDIDPHGLEQTVETFNQHARRGEDPTFQRGESEFDRQTGGDLTRTDLPNPCLAPLDTPPFYGAIIWPGSLGTCGGLHINSHAQVLDVWGKPIQGLYAAGNAACSPMGSGYPGGGGTIGTGLTFAYIAAGHLLASESRG